MLSFVALSLLNLLVISAKMVNARKPLLRNIHNRFSHEFVVVKVAEVYSSISQVN